MCRVYDLKKVHTSHTDATVTLVSVAQAFSAKSGLIPLLKSQFYPPVY